LIKSFHPVLQQQPEPQQLLRQQQLLQDLQQLQQPRQQLQQPRQQLQRKEPQQLKKLQQRPIENGNFETKYEINLETRLNQYKKVLVTPNNIVSSSNVIGFGFSCLLHAILFLNLLETRKYRISDENIYLQKTKVVFSKQNFLTLESTNKKQLVCINLSSFDNANLIIGLSGKLIKRLFVLFEFFAQ
jgi:hypothetical protein